MEDTGRNLIEEIGDNLQVLEKQVNKGNRNSVKLAFRLFTISDGAFTEWLQIMLGQSIRVDPRLFLQELKNHEHLCHELPIVNLGPDFVDKFPESNIEITARIKAINKVSEPDLKRIKESCLKILNENLKQFKDNTAPPIVTIKDKSDYSTVFLDEFSFRSPEYKTITLDSNKLILNNTQIEYFPDYIPIAQEIKMKGQNEATSIELNFTRINQTSINYSLKIENENSSKTGKELDVDFICRGTIKVFKDK